MTRLRQLRHALARSTALVAVTLAAPSALLGLSLVTATAILAKGGEGGEILGRFGAAGGAGPGQPGTNGPAPRYGGGGGGGGANGGSGGAGATGGVGGTTPGQDGGNGGTATGSNGGGGGGGGAAGNAGSNTLPVGSISGGHGGSGGAGGGAGGGGGEGGAGALLTGAGSATIQAGQTVRGGAGGNGGDAGSGPAGTNAAGDGGFAGGGGIGLSLTATTIDNRGVITGGDGGTGGNAFAGLSSLLQSWGSFGGDGGHGVAATGGTLTNSGTITGGNGGLGGLGANGVNLSTRRNAGAGGYGVTGSNLVVINSGTISGGFPGDHLGNEGFRTYAVVFTGGTNVLTLQTGSVLNGPAAANGTSTLNLQGTGTEDSAFVGFQTIDVAGGATWTLSGAVISTSGTTVGVGNAGSLVLSGPLSGGPLIKNGAGTLTLAGANTYTGSTMITGGTVLVDGAIGTGAVDVQSSGTLGGMGTIGGGVTVADGGALRGIQGQTLSMAALALNGTSNVNVTLGAPGGSRLFNVTGNLTLDGTLNVTKAGGFGPGAYRLFDYGGTLTDNGLAIGTVPGGVSASDFAVQTSVANQVNVVLAVAATTNFWDGDTPANANNNVVNGGNGIWTATSNTWTGVDGATNGPLQPQPGFAIFQATSGTVTVDNSAGAVSVTGMQFAVGGYFVQGGAITLADPRSIIRVGDGTLAGVNMTATIAAPLVGSGGLEKTDLGTLVLAGANTYSGGTTITGGILQIGNGGAPGSIIGNVVNNGVLVFTNNANDTFAGVISGSGSVQVNGDLVILTGVNSYTGGTTINGGTLSIAADNNLGDVSGALTLGAGTLLTTAPITTARAVAMAGGTIQTDADLTLTGTISGTGGFTKTGAGTLTVTGTNSYSGTTQIAAGTMAVANGGSLATGRVSVGGATGSNATLRVDGPNSTWQASEIIVGRFGSGTMTVTNGGRFVTTTLGTGDTPDSGGTITVSGTSSIVTATDVLTYSGPGAVTVSNGGRVVSSGTAAAGNNPGGQGTFVVTGAGSVWEHTAATGFFVGFLGAGTLTVADGGLVSVANGTGTVAIANRGSAAGALNIGAASGAPAVAPGTIQAATVQFGTGTGVINFNHTSTDYTFAPAITGTGAINVLAGTTILTPDSSVFSGTTTVSGGTLRVDGALGGTVNVTTGGTLGGTGTITGPVTVGGTLSAGASPGTLTTGTLTLTPGATSRFELGSPGVVGGSTNDLVVVNGNLTLGGALDAQVAAGGYYRLFNYAGTLAGAFDTTNVTGTGGFTVARQQVETTIPNQVNLAVLGAGQTLHFWDGADSAGNGSVDGGTGTWSNTGTNWTGQPGQANVNGTWGGSIGVFAGTAGTVTVVGTQAFDTLQFSTTGYVVGGNGTLAIAPAVGTTGTITVDAGVAVTIGTTIADGTGTSLNKIGAGTLILVGNHTYTGGTTITAGTLQIGNGAPVLGGSIVGNVVNNGALVFANGFNDTFAGVISGSGSVQHIGNSSVALTGANTYTGGTIIHGGAIQIGDGGTSGSIVGNVVVAANAALAFARSDTYAFDGVISGAGGIFQFGDGTTVLTAAHTYTGNTSISFGTLALGAGGSIAHSSRVGLSAGTAFDITAAGNQTINNLIGAAGSTVRLGANTLTVNVTGNRNFSGAITGTGSLVVTGTGTMTLTGANTYTGATTVAAGTLTLGAAGSIASSAAVTVAAGSTLATTGGGSHTVRNLAGAAGSTVTLASTLTVDTSTATAFDGTITGTGGLIKSGAATWILGGMATHTGGTTIDAGTLQLGNGGTTGLVAGNVTNNGTLAFNRADSVTFDGVVSGTGGLRQVGAGTTVLTAASPYSGPTSVENGRLVVNGTIGSSIVTVTGGTLGGTGTVGGIIANSGGTVSPGNSIGTLNVAGNVSFAPGSTYEVEIEPSGTSDRLSATGTATLSGGTVSVIKATGSYTAGTRYTIVTADTGVTGTFSGFTQNLPFINLALAYDPTNVYLDVTRNTVAFCDVTATRNQCAAGRGAESLGAGNALYDAIASLPDTASARQAFNALSGEVHASTKSALIEDSHYLRDAVVARTRRSGNETTAKPQFAALAQATDQSQQQQDGTAITAWFQGFGAIARTAGDGNAATAKRTTGGFFIGADTKIADTWTIGLATGYSRSTIDVDGRSSRATIDSYHLALYGGAQFGSLGVRLGASHTWHSIDSSRSIAFPGLTDAARADYKARTTQLFGDVGYALALGDVALEPFANLAWVHLSTNRFSERGGIAALRARGGSDSNLFSTLGIRAAAQVWNDDNKTLTLRGTLGWRHAFGDVTPAARLAFAGGSSFGVEGVPIARNAAVVEAGFDLKVGKALTIGAGYAGVLASGAHDHAFKGNLTYRF